MPNDERNPNDEGRSGRADGAVNRYMVTKLWSYMVAKLHRYKVSMLHCYMVAFVRGVAIFGIVSAWAAVPQTRQDETGRAREAVGELIQANRNWLLPSLEARRGLVYEYREEEPYFERVTFDLEGNVLARLETTKDSTNHPTRQQLWL